MGDGVVFFPFRLAYQRESGRGGGGVTTGTVLDKLTE